MEVIRSGLGESVEINGRFVLLPFGVECSYVDPAGTPIAESGVDGLWATAGLYGGMLSMLIPVGVSVGRIVNSDKKRAKGRGVTNLG